MRLSELNPEIKAGGAVLVFDCPACRSHKLRVGLNPPMGEGKVPTVDGRPMLDWRRTGDTFEALTLHPSVDSGCWHGWITNGEVTSC